MYSIRDSAFTFLCAGREGGREGGGRREGGWRERGGREEGGINESGRMGHHRNY